MRFLLPLFCLLAAFAQADYGTAILPLGPDNAAATVHFYKFDQKTHGVRLIDAESAPGGPFKRLKQAMEKGDYVAGCNGGFFHRNREPVGLAVADGKVRGSLNLKSSVASGALVSDGKTIRLLEKSALRKVRPPYPKQLVQTGPFLVRNGKAVSGLKEGRYHRRTFVATDGKGTWIIAFTPPTSLARLSKVLADEKTFQSMNIKTALNCDGGASAAFYAKQTRGNPISFREINSVINYIGVYKK